MARSGLRLKKRRCWPARLDGEKRNAAQRLASGRQLKDCPLPLVLPAADPPPPPSQLARLPADKSKAAKAAKAVKKSQFKKERKPRYSVVFHRPKTLVRSRDPKFPRKRCERGGAAAGAGEQSTVSAGKQAGSIGCRNGAVAGGLCSAAAAAHVGG